MRFPRAKTIIIMSGALFLVTTVIGFLLLQQDVFQRPERPAVPDTTLDISSLNAETRALIAEKRKQGKEPNRLILEKSPYLLQHAFNPVDWYAWSEEAFERARGEDKPIFLSIGYSTCYWCHVMERRVFEQDSLARILNDHFVSIKVDREERPDVDRVYMAAVQGMTGSGGWPMSLFLTPDLKPFFAATYIPPEPQYGRPGFGVIARGIHQAWEDSRTEVLDVAGKVAQYLEGVSLPDFDAVEVGEEALSDAFESYSGSYDEEFGGFGGAPKFPRPVSLDFLLAYHRQTGNAKALEMATHTLRRMASGGIYDHVGQGFHRYSTDGRWRVPHFEKMLYDQAQLVNTYLTAFEITGDSLYAGVARGVLAYVDRMMLHGNGGFYSAEDAESAVDPARPEEKEEGAFYTWTASEIDELLEARAANVFKFIFGVEQEGNAVEDPHGEFVGENILFLAHTIEEAAAKFTLPRNEMAAIVDEARNVLFNAREERPKPIFDDKILLSWNGLMISAYANAYRVLGDAHHLDVAERSVQFLYEKLHDPSTGLFKRRYRSGEARYDAHLEDYALLAGGLIDLYVATGAVVWLERAEALAHTMIERFYDREHGGFFATSGEDESILVRSKEYYDGAEPSGNSAAILDFVRLHEITGKPEYERIAGQSLAYFGAVLQRGQTAPMMLRAFARTRAPDYKR